MKSIQRMGGKMMKRSEDLADVGTCLAQFKTTDDMLDRLARDLKAWRDGWDDILKLQYNASEAFANLYNGIEPTDNPDQIHKPTQTPQATMRKCLALQKMYSDMKMDLQQELDMIANKVMRPVGEAQLHLKSLKKTIKHRENTKLDYERYLSRAEHARRKAMKNPNDEAALAKSESDLQQAQISYQTADEQIKETFPPVCGTIMTLLPYLLANQVIIQTTLVGQIYTNMDQYCQSQRLQNPAPGDSEIIRAWDDQFSSFRRELEGSLATIARGKTVHLPMNLPDKDSSTVTGLGIRNKTTNLVHRNKSHQSLPQQRPVGRIAGAGYEAAYENEKEEIAPPKPPRPGATGMGTPRMPSPAPYTGVSFDSKPRMPSYSNNVPYDQKPTNLMPGYPSHNPPPYPESLAGSTPPSRYQTPVNGHPSSVSSNQDYFDQQRRTSAASFASSAASVVAAGKKKPPPPIPAKRLPSQQVQFVTALYDFEGQGAGDLAFREGDRIRVVKKTNNQDDWWDGELNGVKGTFPANYVQL